MLQQAQAFVATEHAQIYNMQGGGKNNKKKTNPIEKHRTTTENDQNGRNN